MKTKLTLNRQIQLLPLAFWHNGIQILFLLASLATVPNDENCGCFQTCYVNGLIFRIFSWSIKTM